MGEDAYRKERRLKKYEAAAKPVATDAGAPPIEYFSPFGPLIARSRVPAVRIEALNRYVDGMPLGGGELHLPESVVSEGGETSLVRLTAGLIRRYLAQAEGAETARVDFESFWVVRQLAGTAGPMHFHSSDVSGVLYLKVPEVDAGEEEKTYISNRRAGYINFLIGGKQRLSRSLISFRPVVGDFYLFPGWLLHGAEPFAGTGERRALSFNARVGEAPG